MKKIIVCSIIAVCIFGGLAYFIPKNVAAQTSINTVVSAVWRRVGNVIMTNPSSLTVSVNGLVISGTTECDGTSALMTDETGAVECGAVTGGGGGSGIVGTGTTGQLPYYASSGETLTATSTLFLSTATKVGIGTSTPDTKLTVLGGLHVAGTLGSNLVTNGTFASDLTGWSGANWSFSGGTALHTAGAATALSQAALGATVGNTYKVTYTLSGYSAGVIEVYYGGIWGRFAFANGTYTDYITPTANTPFTLVPSSDFAGAIDDVSVQLLTTTETSSFETPLILRKKLTINDHIEFSDGLPIRIGYQAGGYGTTGQFNTPASNTIIGYRAGYFNTEGHLTVVGYNAGFNNTTGAMIAMGKWAGYSNTTGFPMLFGYGAGRSNIDGWPTCFGDEVCANATSSDVVAFGAYAAYTLESGDVTALGYRAGYSNLSSGGATNVGYYSGYSNLAPNVTTVGHLAGRFNTTATTTAIGFMSMYNNTTGNSLGLGSMSGYYNTTGTGLYLGNGAGYGVTPANAPATDTGGILIGHNANRSVVTGSVLSNYVGIGDGVLVDKSNQVKLGNDSITQTTLQGNVGVSTTTPNQKLTLFNSSADSAIEFSSANGSTYKWTAGLDFTDGSFRIASSSALGTNDRLIINGAGNVGIGGNPAFAKLTVTGDIYATTGLYTPNGYGLFNSSSGSNASFVTNNAGALINRNVADANPSLIVHQVNAGSTGNILQLQNNTGAVSVFTQTGALGVGSTTPWRTLSVVGTVAINGLSSATGGNAVCISATTFDVQNAGNTTCVTSALRFKENIKDLVSDLSVDTLMKLRPVTFDYKEGYHGKNETAKSYGLIAEEVEKVDSALVDYCDDGKVCTLHFEKITGLIVSAIQNVIARISGLEEKIKHQEEQINSLTKRLDILESKP